mgnify:CR=1 FL=1
MVLMVGYSERKKQTCLIRLVRFRTIKLLIQKVNIKHWNVGEWKDEDCKTAYGYVV